MTPEDRLLLNTGNLLWNEHLGPHNFYLFGFLKEVTIEQRFDCICISESFDSNAKPDILVLLNSKALSYSLATIQPHVVLCLETTSGQFLSFFISLQYRPPSIVKERQHHQFNGKSVFSLRQMFPQIHSKHCTEHTCNSTTNIQGKNSQTLYEALSQFRILYNY